MTADVVGGREANGGIGTMAIGMNTEIPQLQTGRGKFIFQRPSWRARGLPGNCNVSLS